MSGGIKHRLWGSGRSDGLFSQHKDLQQLCTTTESSNTERFIHQLRTIRSLVGCCNTHLSSRHRVACILSFFAIILVVLLVVDWNRNYHSKDNYRQAQQRAKKDVEHQGVLETHHNRKDVGHKDVPKHQLVRVAG